MATFLLKREHTSTSQVSPACCSPSCREMGMVLWPRRLCDHITGDGPCARGRGMLTGWPVWPGLLENISKPSISFRVSWKDSGRQVRPGISSPFHRKGDRAQGGNMEGTSSWAVGPQAGSFLLLLCPPHPPNSVYRKGRPDARGSGAPGQMLFEQGQGRGRVPMRSTLLSARAVPLQTVLVFYFYGKIYKRDTCLF